MAVKNFRYLGPSVTIFAGKLYQKFKNHLDLYVPMKKREKHLLAVINNCKNILRFRIKESRYYEDKDHAWHQETEKQFAKYKDDIDIYVFEIRPPVNLTNSRKKNKFQFVIVPTDELLERVKLKEPDKNRKYNFYFRFVDDDILREVRENKSIVDSNPNNFNYSEYLNAWDLIRKKGKF
ncbi:hypothetical protein ES703_11001 [subsurface metagenome]